MSPQVLKTPDVIAALRSYINALDLGVTAHGSVPEDSTSSFVRLVLVGGGGRSNVIVDPPRVMVESWAESDREAYDLARLMSAQVIAFPLSSSICTHVREAQGPYRADDFETGTPRYRATYILTVRATPLT